MGQNLEVHGAGELLDHRRQMLEEALFFLSFAELDFFQELHGCDRGIVQKELVFEQFRAVANVFPLIGYSRAQSISMSGVPSQKIIKYQNVRKCTGRKTLAHHRKKERRKSICMWA